MSSKEEELLKQIAELKEQLNSVQEENAKLKSHESAAHRDEAHRDEAYSDDLDDFPSKESIWEAMRLVIEYVSERQAIAQVSDD